MGAMDEGAQPYTSEQPTKGPIFIVGSMRSGSTMLRLILDSHPAIAIGAETGFMGAALANKKIPNWKYGAEWYRRLDWTEDELDARLREFYGGMFERFAAAQGKRRWGEKTPFHTSHMAVMAKLFPDATFVGIVRHPGAVASSLRRSFHYSFPEALSYWKAANLDMVRGATDLGARFVACRYEDLVLEGEPVLRELVSFLEEPWSPDLMEHHRVQRGKGAPRVVDGSTSTRDPIDATRAVQWAQTATKADLLALDETAALAGFFGYHKVDPVSREPLVGAESARRWTPSGTDLANRRGTWEQRVDFEERPDAPMLEADPDELARRLVQVERALARTRTRRAVRLADAARTVQRGRSLQGVRQAWSVLRNSGR
jgi:Sulfotransferase family